jgi:hypothetical protein
MTTGTNHFSTNFSYQGSAARHYNQDWQINILKRATLEIDLSDKQVGIAYWH